MSDNGPQQPKPMPDKQEMKLAIQIWLSKEGHIMLESPMGQQSAVMVLDLLQKAQNAVMQQIVKKELQKLNNHKIIKPTSGFMHRMTGGTFGRRKR